MPDLQPYPPMQIKQTWNEIKFLKSIFNLSSLKSFVLIFFLDFLISFSILSRCLRLVSFAFKLAVSSPYWTFIFLPIHLISTLLYCVFIWFTNSGVSSSSSQKPLCKAHPLYPNSQDFLILREVFLYQNFLYKNSLPDWHIGAEGSFRQA